MESVFQFTNPALLKLDFQVNDDFASSGRDEIKLRCEVKTHVNREENAADAFVTLSVTVGEKAGEVPFYVYAEEAARFKWESGIYDEEAIGKLLQQNAPALLLSYLRPVIASVTGLSPYSAYDIPFMNFRECKELPRNKFSDPTP